jgi:hypothetical protein
MIEFDNFYVRRIHKIALPLNKHRFIKTDEWVVKSNKKDKPHFFLPNLITYDVSNEKICLIFLIYIGIFRL